MRCLSADPSFQFTRFVATLIAQTPKLPSGKTHKKTRASAKRHRRPARARVYFWSLRPQRPHRTHQRPPVVHSTLGQLACSCCNGSRATTPQRPLQRRRPPPALPVPGARPPHPVPQPGQALREPRAAWWQRPSPSRRHHRQHASQRGQPPALAAGRIVHRLRRAAVLAVGPWPATRRREPRSRPPRRLPHFLLRHGAAPAVVRQAPGC